MALRSDEVHLNEDPPGKPTSEVAQPHAAHHEPASTDVLEADDETSSQGSWAAWQPEDENDFRHQIWWPDRYGGDYMVECRGLSFKCHKERLVASGSPFLVACVRGGFKV